LESFGSGRATAWEKNEKALGQWHRKAGLQQRLVKKTLELLSAVAVGLGIGVTRRRRREREREREKKGRRRPTGLSWWAA
jgi:hypothetical protein